MTKTWFITELGEQAGPAGEPATTSAAILQLADAEQPPLCLLLGAGLLPYLEREFNSRLEVWNAWQATSEAAHGQTSN